VGICITVSSNKKNMDISAIKKRLDEPLDLAMHYEFRTRRRMSKVIYHWIYWELAKAAKVV
jgi:hypothetical protein